jgi:hypothetical protein
MRQGFLIPIIVTPWDKNEGLVFDGRSENSITIKTIFREGKRHVRFGLIIRRRRNNTN